jgi:hypothetical protein
MKDEDQGLWKKIDSTLQSHYYYMSMDNRITVDHEHTMYALELPNGCLIRTVTEVRHARKPVGFSEALVFCPGVTYADLPQDSTVK